MAITSAQSIGKQLAEKGLIPDNCRRVVIDLEVGDVGRIYYETFADEKMLEVDFSGIGIDVIHAADVEPIKEKQLDKLERGGIYVVEIPHQLSGSALDHVREHFELTGKRRGVEFVVLTDGCRIARSEETAVPTREESGVNV